MGSAVEMLISEVLNCARNDRTVCFLLGHKKKRKTFQFYALKILIILKTA